MAPRPRIPAPLAVAGIVVLLLAVAEGIARAKFDPPASAWLTHPLLGRVRAPGVSTPKLSVDDGKPFELATNVLGMRGKSCTQVKKPAGTYRIFFVGGSTTENPNTPEEKTFAGVVERLLNERLKGSPRVECLNAGVSGNVSAQTLAWVEHRVLALEPDLVVDLEVNDLFHSLNGGWDPAVIDLAQPPRAPKLWDWLVGASRLLAVIEHARDPGDGYDTKAAYVKWAKMRRERPFNDPPDDYLLRGRDAFARTLHRIALLCQDAHVPLALMTGVWLYKANQPPAENDVLWLSDLRRFRSDMNPSPAACRKGVDAFNDVIRDAAKREGALLVDLDARVPKDLAHLVDDVHFSEKGNAVAADAIVEAILRDGALPRVAR